MSDFADRIDLAYTIRDVFQDAHSGMRQAEYDEMFGGEQVLDDCADEIIAAGWRPPARTIETEEELEALPVGTVLVEGDHATPDEVVTGGLMTMPGVFHRFPDGWHVVAGDGARQVPLPATVLWKPEES